MKKDDLKIGMPIYEHICTIGSEGILVGNITEINEDYIVLDTGVKLAIQIDREELFVSGNADNIYLTRII